MAIKVSLLRSTLHESNVFSKENERFIKSIEKEVKKIINEDIIISDIDDYDCTLKLIFIASGGSEGLFLKNIKYLKEPFYLLTVDKNNSLPASLEILNYLNEHNLKGEILHGKVKYIANRIVELIKFKKEQSEIADRLALIGKPSDWLIASIPDSGELFKKYHIELVNIEIDELLEMYNSLLNEKDSKTEEVKANVIYDAIKALLNKYNCKGFSIRCFDLLSSIKATSCLALAKLNSEGYTSACEGDVMALVTMHLIRKHFNVSSFQANPSIIDVNAKTIVFAHCTCPLDMLYQTAFDTHFESKIGIGIRGRLREEDVTVLRLSANLKDVFLEEGKIKENLNRDNLCRTQIKVKFNNDISSILIRPCGNHHIIFYGKNKAQVIKILNEY